jgi:hypothetical protein
MIEKVDGLIQFVIKQLKTGTEVSPKEITFSIHEFYMNTAKVIFKNKDINEPGDALTEFNKKRKVGKTKLND